MSQSVTKSLSPLLGPMRLPFLTLVPVCVGLGAATAYQEIGSLPWLNLILALIGGLAAQISVNALNEYDDYRSGLDLKTERTPFSGGSGALPQNPDKARYALVTGLVSLLVVVLIGLFFMLKLGWAIAPLGLLGILVVVSYTPWLTRSSLLCLIAPGLGFGTFMVLGTHFVLTGGYSLAPLLASFVPFFLISGLLLMNQFPDLEADREVGRKHLIIAHGPRVGILIYGLLLLDAALIIVLGAVFGPLPMLGLISLLALIPGWLIWRGLKNHHENIPELIPFMGKNILLSHAVPLLLALGIFFG
jgi:1,4-dihydroxy-2-naphthoate polyprenyltransferase